MAKVRPTINGDTWNTAGSWDLGAAPVLGDDAFVPHGNRNNIDCSTSQVGVDMDDFRLHEGFSKSVGLSGTPLIAAADLISNYSNGDLYFSCAADGSGQKTDEVVIQTASNNNVTELNSLTGDKGDYDRIICNRGTLRLLGTIAFGASMQLIVQKVDADSDSKVDIAAGAETIPDATQESGTVISRGVVTTARLGGGTWTQDIAAATTVDVFRGATFVLNYGGIDVTSATTIRVHDGGTLDMLQNTKPKIVTNLWGNSGSIIKYDRILHVFTNKRTIGAGGTTWPFFDYRTSPA